MIRFHTACSPKPFVLNEGLFLTLLITYDRKF